MFEPWPDEPDESEVERRWGNPERDLPRTPRIPEVSTNESDADPHTLQTFWVSVIFANAAVFGVSLGAMLWYFRGQMLLGGLLIVAGILAGLRTYASYRAFKNRDPEEAAETEDDEADRSGPDSPIFDDSADTADAATPDDPADTDDTAAPDDTAATDSDERNG